MKFRKTTISFLIVLLILGFGTTVSAAGSYFGLTYYGSGDKYFGSASNSELYFRTEIGPTFLSNGEVIRAYGEVLSQASYDTKAGWQMGFDPDNMSYAGIQQVTNGYPSIIIKPDGLSNDDDLYVSYAWGLYPSEVEGAYMTFEWLDSSSTEYNWNNLELNGNTYGSTMSVFTTAGNPRVEEFYTSDPVVIN